MKYQLKWCSWEITRNCNMDCDICLCGGLRNEGGQELNSEEALELCDQMIQMSVERVVLTGGEPLLRRDWDRIAQRLSRGGVEVQLITNGSLVDPSVIEKMKTAGIQKVSVSIDGTEEIHDTGRMKGSFRSCCEAIQLLQDTQIPVFVATTVTANNYDDLPALKDALVHMGVEHWGLQLGLPFGNFASRNVDVLKPEQISELIDFCYQADRQGDLLIYPGENIGYYTCKEAVVRSRALSTSKIPVYEGCPAGISTLGIGYDGTIVGMSMCVDRFTEGNIRTRSLKEIWEDENSFAWRRNMTRDKLQGFCGKCEYGDICLGGCPAVRYGTTGSLYSENHYCAYRVANCIQ